MSEDKNKKINEPEVIKEGDRLVLSQKTRRTICNRHQFLQGTWNFERMQNGGWAYSLIPAIKALYKDKDSQSQALKRHLEFYNTHPYVSAPVLGVTLAMEEERANGTPIDDAAINGVKVGMMGPLAGVGDPVFWFTLRPILGALGASLALGGSILGPILFFVLWNLIRYAFLWKTQEFGYTAGKEITKDLSGGLLGRVTLMASILGMFIIGALVQRWVNVDFTIPITKVTQDSKTFIDWANLPAGAEGIKHSLEMYNTYGVDALNPEKVTTLQDNIDLLIPGLVPLLLTLGISKLLKKDVSPITIIIALFIIGIVARYFHIM
ncbi:PTS system mannose/fructose/sorbose family transporter subunit IID [uncultured Anaerococcus sp.]|uniref:PTS system mannose/fructose/sorbose family transporter subunit IID n=1 Tax=uncultured Anaerococcus sp. TaxID=293428 RepID=UPI002606FC75|nr:PTS system mannose/fructose/sorbose family transporter subunit IID [uncultured Anaerococcus sp.]